MPRLKKAFGDVSVIVGDDRVATVEIHRPPNNSFDTDLIRSLADAYEAIDDSPDSRAIVLCSEGKHFCTGADVRVSVNANADNQTALYAAAARMFAAQTPVVAAIQGAAIGGGLGLACTADFRVACLEARFASNFTRLGFHHGFGLSVTLPPLVGQQRSYELLYTGRRIKGDEAFAIGLCDRFAPIDEVRSGAHDLAREIASAAPLAIRATRRTMRSNLLERFGAATLHESAEQRQLMRTDDWAEGIRADLARRPPVFRGR